MYSVFLFLTVVGVGDSVERRESLLAEVTQQYEINGAESNSNSDRTHRLDGDLGIDAVQLPGV